MKIRMRAAVVFAAVFLMFGQTAFAQAKADQKGATLSNLQAAFDGESNAGARYAAFAKKADAEGYLGVGSLFRAAAKAEEIHAANLSKTIEGMGAKPKADLKPPVVKTTKENLEAALKGETYEKDSMYPGFIKAAEAEKNDAALRNFKGAMAAEAMHAKYYADALANLDKWKAAKRAFLVCSVCGYTEPQNPALKKCPVCSAPSTKFTAVK